MPKAANAPQGRTAHLVCGAIAGPLFASAFTAIGAARAGYDWERLPVSSLAIGRHGWLQRMNFVVAGVLYSCAGGGLRRSANRRVGPRAVSGARRRRRCGPDRFRRVRHRPGGRLPAPITRRGGPGSRKLGRCADPGRAAAQPFRHPGLHRHPRRRHGARGHRRTGPGLPLGRLLGGSASPWSGVSLCSASPSVTSLAWPPRVGSSSGHRSHAGAAGSPPFRYTPAPPPPQ